MSGSANLLFGFVKGVVVGLYVPGNLLLPVAVWIMSETIFLPLKMSWERKKLQLIREGAKTSPS